MSLRFRGVADALPRSWRQRTQGHHGDGLLDGDPSRRGFTLQRGSVSGEWERFNVDVVGEAAGMTGEPTIALASGLATAARVVQRRGRPGSDATECADWLAKRGSRCRVNLRRIAASSEREQSRYADLVRLARWFDSPDDANLMALWASTCGL